MKNTKDIRVPLQHLRAEIAPQSFDADSRTMEMRWYGGSTVLRNSFFDGPYMLKFSMDPKAIRMNRLQSGGAPFKLGHGSS
ncbi:MAG: peptidase, partial [Gemmatimonadales bacterium]